MMNKDIWGKIEKFDFDLPRSEYDFTLRLADENYWNQNFTKQAILEYKKFMYLAAVSDKMVSPSEIVDTVWHQHLIFTQSYSDFCKILGKQIQHIPSTHNKKDFQKFKLAKERTKKLYETHFGNQPENI
ncbi:glycine-rich domain-containing protein [Chryseobacterium sp. GP-SGM7]|uniref:glycine-rich domain-containing protein n=1 Tax=Chryseobacterium sp. GP-SGM7 TaxID=3411323 RepID=UPI003B95344E